MSKAKILLVITICVSMYLIVQSYTNIRTFGTELSNARSILQDEVVSAKISSEFGNLRNEANTLLKAPLSLYSEAMIYSEISKVSGDLIVINVAYDDPTKQVEETTEAATEAGAEAPAKTVEPNSSFYITLRGNVSANISALDSKFPYSIISYKNEGEYELVTIRVGGKSK